MSVLGEYPKETLVLQSTSSDFYAVWVAWDRCPDGGIRCKSLHIASQLETLINPSESMTTKHLIHQFKLAIHDALSSKTETRAIMRARSAKQRFPVVQWVQDLETLQSTAIKKHKRYSRCGHRRYWIPSFFCKCSASSPAAPPSSSGSSEAQTSGAETISQDISSPFGSRSGPGHTRSSESKTSKTNSSRNTEGHTFGVEESSDDENNIVYGDQQVGLVQSPVINRTFENGRDCRIHRYLDEIFEQDVPPAFLRDGTVCSLADTLTIPPSGMSATTGLGIEDGLSSSHISTPNQDSAARSLLSIDSVVKEKHNYNLQKVSPFFTDSNNEYAKKFEKKLENVNGKNSEDQLCVEEYLSRSEKDWFNRYRDVKLGRSPLGGTPVSSVFRLKMSRSNSPPQTPSPPDEKPVDQFLLPKDYVPPSGLKRFLLRRIGDWPVYSILLGFVSRRKG